MNTTKVWLSDKTANMRTPAMQAAQRVEDKLNSALWRACAKNIALACDWRNKALAAIKQGQPLTDFVLHSVDKRSAKAAYQLAAFEVKQ